jgi:hypothetical protein
VQSTGEWWVSLATGAAFATSHWATWDPSLPWVDVQLGDFNGDGKADVTGRLPDGSWWTGLSNGAAFGTSQWGSWPAGDLWVDVHGGRFA